MIKIENVEVYGWEHAIRGMRNPLESWDKSDSEWNSCDDSCAKWDECHVGYHCPTQKFEDDPYFCVGKNDLALMKRLSRAGQDHGKFMRMIVVWLDITAPLYWWKEFDTYKVGTVANSYSTMHKIHARPLTIRDFSTEHLEAEAKDALLYTLCILNGYRGLYCDYNSKDDWYNMIQLLPSSYNQRRTVMLNYAVLKSMYHARKNHKLNEWRDFCDWIETLPYSELITEQTEWTKESGG